MGVVESLVHSVELLGVHTDSQDLSTPAERIVIDKTQEYINGTGSNQVNKPWHDQVTVDAASETHDLTDGTLIDAFGDAIAFTKIKILIIHNLSTTSGEDLTISGNFLDNDVLGGGSSTVILGPGGVLCLTSPIDGFTVTETTGDVLTVDPGAGTITYDIVLIGTV